MVLFARRGNIGRKSRRVSQLIRTIDDGDWTPETITSELRGHSTKPDIVRQRITALMGEEHDKIELFARKKAHGWDTWGNDHKLAQEPLEGFL